MQCFVIMCSSLGGVSVRTTHRDPQLGDNRRTETPHLFKREEDHHSKYKDNFTQSACAQCSKLQGKKLLQETLFLFHVMIMMMMAIMTGSDHRTADDEDLKNCGSTVTMLVVRLYSYERACKTWFPVNPPPHCHNPYFY